MKKLSAHIKTDGGFGEAWALKEAIFMPKPFRVVRLLNSTKGFFYDDGAAFVKLSFSPTVLLNTGFCEVPSGSGTRYPLRIN